VFASMLLRVHCECVSAYIYQKFNLRVVLRSLLDCEVSRGEVSFAFPVQREKANLKMKEIKIILRSLAISLFAAMSCTDL
jgi:hypothetical protein